MKENSLSSYKQEILKIINGFNNEAITWPKVIKILEKSHGVKFHRNTLGGDEDLVNAYTSRKKLLQKMISRKDKSLAETHYKLREAEWQHRETVLMRLLDARGVDLAKVEECIQRDKKGLPWA